MSADFDSAAISYDNEFTHTAVGKLQRNRVWKYLSPIVEVKSRLNILEINCGTGEDAIQLGTKGHQVLATDISEGMLKAIAEKVKRHHLQDSINTKPLSIQQLNQLEKNQFDLIFSNFGGLNCISPEEFQQFATTTEQLLNSGGKAVLVIMPRFTLIETLYFLLKLKFSRAFVRRKKGSTPIIVNGTTVDTWYYSAKKMNQFFASKSMLINKVKPIGIFLPPSYLNPFFEKHPLLLNFLNTLEKLFGEIGWLVYASDHYLIELEKK